MPEGAILTIPSLWAVAQDWYGGYLDLPWRKRTTDEARQQLFARHGFTSSFWSI
jgi:hypothetical protein